MSKFAKKLLTICMTVCCAFSAVACGGNSGGGNEGDGTLTISVVKLGYGVEWLNKLAAAFEKKENIKVTINPPAIGATGQAALDTEIESKASSTDLFFNKRGWFSKAVYEGSIVATNGQRYDCLYEDLTDVWNSVVDEGSNKTIKDKMDPTYVTSSEIEGKYYSLPWAGGVYGIVRNLSKWEELGLTDNDVPYTTNELFELCDKVKSDVAPFIYSLENEYYSGWLPIFFAQYEGKENAEMFMSGKDPDGEVSEHIYTYDGQIEALKVLQTLLGNGYQHDKSSAIDFTSMQGQFIRGAALFSINGSWLESEAANFSAAKLDMIKTPVISSIVQKLSFCPTDGNGKKIKADNFTAEQKKAADEKLVEVIKYVDAIDAGETATKPADVTDDDIKKVTEARHYSYMAGGTDHQAYIPSYAAHVENAKKFLKFMYSDEGLNIYYEALKGTMLPATPVNGYSSELSLSDFRKSVNAATAEGYVFDRIEKARYFVLGSVSACFTNSVKPVVAIREKKTPQYIIDENSKDVANKWSSIKQMLNIK